MIGLFRVFGDATRIILLTGFMGAFTTFSSFIPLAPEDGRWIALAVSICGQILRGLRALRGGNTLSLTAFSYLVVQPMTIKKNARGRNGSRAIKKVQD